MPADRGGANRRRFHVPRNVWQTRWSGGGGLAWVAERRLILTGRHHVRLPFDHAVEQAEHWNAEMLGWHVAKHGTRFEAVQALAMAVRQQFGQLRADAARGLALRHDHGSNFMADHFQKHVKFRGITPSCAFVREPETKGVIECMFRTLTEQAIHGRVFETIDDVRKAVAAFADKYNEE